MRGLILSIPLLSGALWIDVAQAAAQKSEACLVAMSNEHGILVQLAQFATKSEQEKAAAKEDYCKLQASRRDSLQVLKAMGSACDLYTAAQLDTFILSNQRVVDKKCK